MIASSLLERGESALIICTDGRHLEFDGKGFGRTGQWKIDPHRQVHKVIIYKRDIANQLHEIYVADYVDTSDAEMERRYVVSLANVQSRGTTTSNWHEFAEVKPGARNPVRYLEKQ